MSKTHIADQASDPLSTSDNCKTNLDLLVCVTPTLPPALLQAGARPGGQLPGFKPGSSLPPRLRLPSRPNV